MTSQFWSDLHENLKDSEYARAYARESIRVNTIDALVQQLEEARSTAGLSKAALARAIDTEPSVVRRLLSSTSVNPTVGTLAEVAAVLGMRITLIPMSSSERDTFTRSTSSSVASLTT